MCLAQPRSYIFNSTVSELMQTTDPGAEFLRGPVFPVPMASARSAQQNLALHHVLIRESC